MREMDWPRKKRLKLGTDRAEKVRRRRADQPARHRPAPAPVRGWPGVDESLGELLQHRQRQQHRFPLRGVELVEAAREGVVALRADPVEQGPPLRRRLHPADPPVGAVGEPSDQPGLLELGDETREHRRVEAGETRQVGQADGSAPLGGHEDVDLRGGEHARGLRGPQATGKTRHGDAKPCRAQLRAAGERGPRATTLCFPRHLVLCLLCHLIPVSPGESTCLPASIITVSRGRAGHPSAPPGHACRGRRLAGSSRAREVPRSRRR